jgi:predicted TIM-barrel fold metal-dependent hydrolase
VVDFLLDTTRAALNLVYRNVTVDYPRITFILAHSGGFLPFASARGAGGLALLSGVQNPSIVTYFLSELEKFHADIAISASTVALSATTKFWNSTQITFGSDYPYAPVSGIQQNTMGLDSFLSMLGGGKQYSRRVNFNNSYKLFKKFLN